MYQITGLRMHCSFGGIYRVGQKHHWWSIYILMGLMSVLLVLLVVGLGADRLSAWDEMAKSYIVVSMGTQHIALLLG
jgi:hypothetical protein